MTFLETVEAMFIGAFLGIVVFEIIKSIVGN